MDIDIMKEFLIKEYNEAKDNIEEGLILEDVEFWTGYGIAIRNVASFMKIKLPNDNSLDFKKVQVDE